LFKIVKATYLNVKLLNWFVSVYELQAEYKTATIFI